MSKRLSIDEINDALDAASLEDQLDEPDEGEE